MRQVLQRFKTVIKTGARWVSAAAFVALFLVAPPANASSINWTLTGVTLGDDGTVSGTFSTDSGIVTAFDISTTKGFLPTGEYNSATSSLYCSYSMCSDIFGPNSFVISKKDGSTYINLAFTNPLTTPGIDNLVPGKKGPTGYLTAENDWIVGGSWECSNCDAFRSIEGGSAEGVVSQTVTPLPATISLFVTGLGLIGLLARRRKPNAVGDGSLSAVKS